MMLSVLIPTYNRREKVERLIESILVSDLDKGDYEIIVIDDCSEDDTAGYLKGKYKNLDNFFLIEKKQNSRKSNSVNLGYEKSKGKYIFIIDDDTVVDKRAVRDMLDYFEKNGDGFMLSPIMYDYEGKQKNKIWFTGLKMNFWTTGGNFIRKNELDKGNLEKEIATDGIVTAFMVPRKIFQDIGLFNEKLFPFQFEELDFCVRAGYGGYKLKVITSAKIWHDHIQGIFLDNPWRLYLVARNRILIARLWSKSDLQIIISQGVSFFTALAYIGAKTLIYRKNYQESIKAVFKGIRDGFRMASKLTPYRKRKKEFLGYEIF